MAHGCPDPEVCSYYVFQDQSIPSTHPLYYFSHFKRITHLYHVTDTCYTLLGILFNNNISTTLIMHSSLSLPNEIIVADNVTLCSDCHGVLQQLQKISYDVNITSHLVKFRNIGAKLRVELKPSIQKLQRSAERCRSCFFFLEQARRMGKTGPWVKSEETRIKLDFSPIPDEANTFKLIIGRRDGDFNRFDSSFIFRYFTSRGRIPKIFTSNRTSCR